MHPFFPDLLENYLNYVYCRWKLCISVSYVCWKMTMKSHWSVFAACYPRSAKNWRRLCNLQGLDLLFRYICIFIDDHWAHFHTGLPIQQQSRDTMNGYFTQLDVIVRQRKTSNRIRFMIQDVMDLRRNQWKPRREDNNPKTIEQIHKDAERERTEQEQELMNAPNYPGQMGQSSRDRPGDRRDRDDRNRKTSRKFHPCYFKCKLLFVSLVYNSKSTQTGAYDDKTYYSRLVVMVVQAQQGWCVLFRIKMLAKFQIVRWVTCFSLF